MAANTQDLQVLECYADRKGEVTCRVVWQGETRPMPLDSLLNEINKTAVFAHGYAQAAQTMAKGKV